MTGRTHKRLFVIGITIALLAGTSWGKERTWTDDSSAFTLVAELVEVRGDEVVLRRQNGKQVTVPLAKLSAKDRQFLTQRKEGDSSEAENPFNGRQSLPVPPAPPESPPGKPKLVDTIKKLMTREQVALGGPIVNSVGMVFVPIPPGEFLMGSPESELRYDDETQHEVKITKAFYLSVHEVTQQQYEQVMGENPSDFTALGDLKDYVSGIDTSQFPVENVSWNDAVEFCRKLSDEEGVEYRLPTEAEWEYACRAGTSTAYSSGSSSSQLDTIGWFGDNSGKTVIDSARIWDTDEDDYLTRLLDNSCRPHVVGRKAPNAWGLYDMHGNAFEWCQDWYAPYGNEKVTDPTGAASGSRRVLRGGAFDTLPLFVRAANRYFDQPVFRYLTFGFRLARTYPLSP